MRNLFGLLLISILVGHLQSAHATDDSAGGYVGTFSEKKKVVLIFVHGVLGDDRATWTNPNGTYWPDLVSRDSTFRDANVYVHRYASPKLETAQDIEELARRMGAYFDKDRVISHHNKLIFVAHSMGGLVTRAFLVQRRVPYKKVAMIFFFGTPSGGANAAALATLVSKNQQFKNMQPFVRGTYVEQLAMKWLATSIDQATGYPRSIWSFCAYEKKPYFGHIVVEEFSAIYLCNAPPVSILENHLDIVKPASDRSESHVYLSNAYRFSLNPTSNLKGALDSPGSSFVFGGELLGFPVERSLRVRTDVFNVGIAEVGCTEESKGTKTIRPNIKKGEVILAAYAGTDSSRNIESSLVSASVVPDGNIVMNYAVKGSASPEKCQEKGFAKFSVKYLVVDPK